MISNEKLESFKAELKRIEDPPSANAIPQNLGAVRFVVTCSGNACEVSKKTKEVLKIIAESSVEEWPSESQWLIRLPVWFVESCATEMSDEEAEKWLAHWKTLTPDEQEQLERDKQWSLSDWLYWLEPEMRSWFWWDAVEVDPDKLIVAVEVAEWPFPWGAFSWLLRASGATRVESED